MVASRSSFEQQRARAIPVHIQLRRPRVLDSALLIVDVQVVQLFAHRPGLPVQLLRGQIRCHLDQMRRDQHQILGGDPLVGLTQPAVITPALVTDTTPSRVAAATPVRHGVSASGPIAVPTATRSRASTRVTPVSFCTSRVAPNSAARSLRPAATAARRSRSTNTADNSATCACRARMSSDRDKISARNRSTLSDSANPRRDNVTHPVYRRFEHIDETPSRAVENLRPQHPQPPFSDDS